MDHFRRTADVATKPFIYLSAGVSNAEFTESLELAAEAGTRFSGVLCGRATWKDGIPVYGKQGARRVPQVARERRRQEHRERQRAPQGGAPLVRVLRREVGRRAGVSQGRTREPAHKAEARFRFAAVSWRLDEARLAAAQRLDPAHLAQAGVAGVRHTHRVVTPISAVPVSEIWHLTSGRRALPTAFAVQSMVEPLIVPVRCRSASGRWRRSR